MQPQAVEQHKHREAGERKAGEHEEVQGGDDADDALRGRDEDRLDGVGDLDRRGTFRALGRVHQPVVLERERRFARALGRPEVAHGGGGVRRLDEDARAEVRDKRQEPEDRHQREGGEDDRVARRAALHQKRASLAIALVSVRSTSTSCATTSATIVVMLTASS